MPKPKKEIEFQAVIDPDLKTSVQVCTNLEGNCEVRVTPETNKKLCEKAREVGLHDVGEYVTYLILQELKD